MSKALDGTALTIGIIGAVNWGLIGFFNFNLVSFLFGSNWFSRILYALVGLCGLYLLTFYGRTGGFLVCTAAFCCFWRAPRSKILVKASFR